MQDAQKGENESEYAITHVFQPIYCLKNHGVVGYEALLRDSSQLQISPIALFKEAHKKGCRNVLDRTSIKRALETFKDQSQHLFLNIFPSTLMESDFLSWWDQHVPALRPVVLEFLEHEPIKDWKVLKTVTQGLKTRGVKIALDDMGAGYSSVRQWIELEPDFIKLDRYFAENLSVCCRKQKTARIMVDLFSDATTAIIIEGVENEEDLNAAKQLGINYAQGYLLGRPIPFEDLFA